MNIKIAKNSGFCFGVKRAIKIALDESKNFDKLVTLGPIIHNPQMVQKLAEKGITSIDDIDSASHEPVIIRSHGVTEQTLTRAKKEDIHVIDATCPYVSKAQQYVKSLSKDGYPVIILGNKDHPEVVALRSYVEGEVYVIAGIDELPDKYFHKVGVISQTTQRLKKLQALISALLAQSKEVKVINTICNATSVRQDSTRKLAAESDVMIVIGGKNSSNTKMLASISQELVPTHHIEEADEFDFKWLDGVDNVGLTAGASTPDWIILDVYNKIASYLDEAKDKVRNVEDIPGYKEEKNVYE